MDAIDEFIRTANAAIATDYERFLDICNNFTQNEDTVLPKDPYSKDYEAAVLKSYLAIAKLENYKPAQHEVCSFDAVDAPVAQQFPFSTGDTRTVGRYLMGIGHILNHMGTPKGGRVVEYGCGWGHLAFAAAESGLHVTCVDIEPGFVELINRRAAREQLPVRAYQGSFGERPDGMEPVDTVIFYEAFHHSLEHASVLEKIHLSLKEGGKIVLGGEPIYPNYPKPWGLRMDGHALWAIRSFKWMELGFDEQYFIRLLLRYGFLPSRQDAPQAGPLGLIFLGMKPAGAFSPGTTLLPADEAATFATQGSEGTLFALKNSRLSIADRATYRRLEVGMENYLNVPLKITVSLGAQTVPMTIAANSAAKIQLELEPNCGPLQISSESHRPIDLKINDDKRTLGVAVTSLRYE